MTKVAFATPSLSHHVCLEYFGSMLGVVNLSVQAGFQLAWMTRGGDQFIAKVRSKLVEEFLASDAEVMFWVDDDVGFPPEKVIEFVRRPEEIIAGIYPKKQDNPRDWPVLLMSDQTGELVRHDGLIKAGMIPMGFTKVHRKVFEDLAKQLDAAPQDAPVRFREREADGVVRAYRSFFNCGIGPDGQWWGEDHAWCQNVMALGYDVWVDPDVEFTHRGNKVWSGAIRSDVPTFEERAMAEANKIPMTRSDAA